MSGRPRSPPYASERTCTGVGAIWWVFVSRLARSHRSRLTDCDSRSRLTTSPGDVTVATKVAKGAPARRRRNRGILAPGADPRATVGAAFARALTVHTGVPTRIENSTCFGQSPTGTVLDVASTADVDS